MKPMRLYRKLHKGSFSIQSYIKDKGGYHVTDRATSAILEDCTFRVYESGRQKVLKEKRKNVHAYVEFGSYRKIQVDIDVTNLREIYYNPYRYNSFVYRDSEKIVSNISRILAHNNKLYDFTN